MKTPTYDSYSATPLTQKTLLLPPLPIENTPLFPLLSNPHQTGHPPRAHHPRHSQAPGKPPNTRIDHTRLALHPGTRVRCIGYISDIVPIRERALHETQQAIELRYKQQPRRDQQAEDRPGGKERVRGARLRIMASGLRGRG